MKRSSKCRNRPMRCDRCGYAVYGTRGWWGNGFPHCPCGGTILPTKPADLAWCGIIGPDDMGQAEWNAICRENDWPIVRNAGQHATAVKRGTLSEADNVVRPVKPQCAYPGCGKWTAGGAEHCPEHAHELEAALPF